VPNRKNKWKRKKSERSSGTQPCASREHDLGQSGGRGTRALEIVKALCEGSHLIPYHRTIVRNLPRPPKLIRWKETNPQMVVQRHNDEHHREELPAGTWMVIWCCDWLTIIHTVSSRYVKLNATVLGDECDYVEGIVITLETRLVSRSAEWIGSFLGLCSKTWDDGGETWLDYLVNRVLAKNEGSHPEKIVQKPRNNCSVNSGGGRAHGQLTRGPNALSPETNTNEFREKVRRIGDF